jgi:hypothetical protein
LPTACASRAACAQSPSPSHGLLRGRRGLTPALGRGQAQRGQKCPGAPPIFLICKRPALLAQYPTPSGCAPPLMPPARSLLPFQAPIRCRAHGARMHAHVRVRELNPLSPVFGFFLSSEGGIPSQGEAKPSVFKRTGPWFGIPRGSSVGDTPREGRFDLCGSRNHPWPASSWLRRGFPWFQLTALCCARLAARITLSASARPTRVACAVRPHRKSPRGNGTNIAAAPHCASPAQRLLR